MNESKRLLFQVILWTVIWLLLLFVQNLELQFIKENISVFVFQMVLIVFVIYYAAPVFLFKKKYISFFLVSLSVIVYFSFLSSFFFSRPPPPKILSKENLNLSPPILVHLSQSFILLITYLAALFIENMWFLQQKENETLLIKNEAVQSELKLLKSQINPHFLFNTLNNIYALTEIDTQKTRKSISYLSNMLRYVLYECEQAFVPLHKEVKYLQDYIELFSMKSSRKYPIKTEVQIIDNNLQIAPMLLIPFIENALKHSNVERDKIGFIHIFINATSEKILFEIENSLPSSTVNKDKIGGIGLENVRKRLQILYPKKHQLKIIKNAVTFKVQLELQLSTHA